MLLNVDLGKLTIPTEILEKPCQLTEKEFSQVKGHAYYTYVLLDRVKGLEEIKEYASMHHERLDGTGYPFKLKGSDLSLGAQIMAIADIFTALSENRPYRKGMQKDGVIKILQEMSLENKIVALGFLNLLTRGSGNAIQASEFIKMLMVMLSLVIVYASQLSVCVPLAFVLKKLVLVVAIYYGITILSAQLIALSASSKALDYILSKTPFGGDYIFLTMDSGTVDIVTAIFGSLVFMMVMLAITYVAFRKAEIK